MRSDVVIVGYRLNAKEPAAKALERILGLSPQAARSLARSFPALVARNVAEGQAEALAEELRAAGANVELRAAEVDAQQRVESAKPPPRPATVPAERKAGGASSQHSQLSQLAPAAERRAEAAIGAPPKAQLGQLDAPPRSTPQGAVDAAVREAGARSAAAGAFELQELSGSYQLGDFGFAGPAAQSAPTPAASRSETASLGLPAQPREAPPVQPPPRAPGDDLSLDFATDEALALELDEPAPRGSRMELGGSSAQAAPQDLHTLGERFDDLAPSANVPQVEARAFRAIQQRGVARPEARRSLPPPGRATRVRRAVAAAVGAWLPSTLMFAALCVGSALAVGYALDPSDIVGALRREAAAPAFASQREPQRAEAAADRAPDALHPLLRAAPSSVRSPLAAILRARISGVHQVPVSFTAEKGRNVDCVLVEARGSAREPRMEGPATADPYRIEALRATGEPVEPPAPIAAQLREHARALSGSAANGAALTPLCLAL